MKYIYETIIHFAGKRFDDDVKVMNTSERIQKEAVLLNINLYCNSIGYKVKHVTSNKMSYDTYTKKYIIANASEKFGTDLAKYIARNTDSEFLEEEFINNNK